MCRRDLLTTADDALKARLLSLPGGGWLSRRLRLSTDFVGTTVSEYAVLPMGIPAARQAAALRARAGRRMLTIVKDLPQDSPLLPDADNAHARALAQALADAGFILVEGQALAHVPIDFSSLDEYLARLSRSRRQNLRRKLRSRAQLQVQRIPTGAAFADDVCVDAYYALFDAVYAQSEIDRAASLELARQAAAVERGREVNRRFLGEGTPYTPQSVDFYGR